MKVKVANASSRKTRNLIKIAFAELLKEKKAIENITIKELVKNAGITRGTFYTHYDNIYDVAKDLQDEVLDVFFSNINQINTVEDIHNYLYMIFKHLETHESLYKMILSTDEPLLFMNRLNRMMNKHLNDFFKYKNLQINQLNITFFVDGTTLLFIRYFKGEINISLKELYSYVINMLKDFLNLK